jgi:hypothetical protein
LWNSIQLVRLAGWWGAARLVPTGASHTHQTLTGSKARDYGQGKHQLFRRHVWVIPTDELVHLFGNLSSWYRFNLLGAMSLTDTVLLLVCCSNGRARSGTSLYAAKMALVPVHYGPPLGTNSSPAELNREPPSGVSL